MILAASGVFVKLDLQMRNADSAVRALESTVANETCAPTYCGTISTRYSQMKLMETDRSFAHQDAKL